MKTTKERVREQELRELRQMRERVATRKHAVALAEGVLRLLQGDLLEAEQRQRRTRRYWKDLRRKIAAGELKWPTGSSEPRKGIAVAPREEGGA